MDSTVTTHEKARELLNSADPDGALRVAGPMLQDNPGDITAWHIAAIATYQLGGEKVAYKNLASLALAMAEGGNPLQAIACALELREIGGDPTDLIDKLAALYGHGSERVEETEMSPPPLPATVSSTAWGPELSAEQVVSRAADAMAMAWGAALTLSEKKRKLPYVPLISALDPADFVGFIKSMTRRSVCADELVIEQGTAGKAMYILAEGSVVVRQLSESGEAVELARLGPGAFFGEMALVSNATRAAEVRTVEKSVLLRAGKAEMEELAQRASRTGEVLIAFCHARMLENLLRVSPVLAPVPPRRRPDLIAAFGTDYRVGGQVIIEEGSEGPGLFLVVSGRVDVTRKENGEVIHVASLGPGDVFGEISLLMRKPSTATVTAEQNTALLVLPGDRFAAATAQFPELLKGAYDIAVDREERNNSILGQTAHDADELILI